MEKTQTLSIPKFDISLQKLLKEIRSFMKEKHAKRIPHGLLALITNEEVIHEFSTFFSLYLKTLTGLDVSAYNEIEENEGIKFLKGLKSPKEEKIISIILWLDSHTDYRIEVVDFFLYHHPSHVDPDRDKNNITLEDLKLRTGHDTSRTY